MRRREAVVGIGASAASLISRSFAQEVRSVRLGYLSGGARGFQNYVKTLLDGLTTLGWRVGERLILDERYAEGDALRIPALAQELVALRPDVIACTGAREAKALQASTGAIPIVFMLVLDPVGQGLVASIARPRGNITGLSQGPQLLWGKRLEILSELLGHKPRRLFWLGNPLNPGTADDWANAESAAMAVGAEIKRVDASDLSEIGGAFDRLDNADALLVPFDFLFSTVPGEIAKRAQARRLPAIYANRTHADAGGLVSYGGDIRGNFREGAGYVDRILKGARPSELPVIQASRFELVLNMQTAKELGLKVPTSLLAQADDVIE